MTTSAARPVGRPASATPEQVLELATAQFERCERVDVQAIAADLGLSRATVYRWFGSREGLLGAMLAAEFVRLVTAARARTRRTGALGVLDTFDQTVRWMVDNEPYRVFIAAEQAVAGRIITASDGPVQPKAVETFAAQLQRGIDEGYESPVDVQTFAYALIRLAEAFIYQDAVAGIRGDVDRLHDVIAAFLGVDER